MLPLLLPGSLVSLPIMFLNPGQVLNHCYFFVQRVKNYWKTLINSGLELLLTSTFDADSMFQIIGSFDFAFGTALGITKFKPDMDVFWEK